MALPTLRFHCPKPLFPLLLAATHFAALASCSNETSIDLVYSSADNSTEVLGNFTDFYQDDPGNSSTRVAIVVRPSNTFPITRNNVRRKPVASQLSSGERKEETEPTAGPRDLSKFCHNGTPLVMSGGTVYCSLNKACPNQYWCHIGTSRDTTYCCPKNSDQDPCHQPLVRGEGDSKISRYYYDPQSNACSWFKYSGTGGNQNNFLTKFDCTRACVGQDSAGGVSRETSIERPQTELVSNGTSNHDLPRACTAAGPVQGTGDQPSVRFYYDVQTRQCYSFTYYGEGGSENNFESEMSCMLTCSDDAIVNAPGPRRQPYGGAPQPYPAGPPSTGYGATPPPAAYTRQPVIANTAPVYTNPPENEYKSTSYGTNPCAQPPNPGSGSYGSSRRWYYDPSSQQCTAFDYSGTGGNQNNFRSQEECQNTCGSPLFIDSSICSYTQDSGNGPYSIPRWAWITQSQRCNQFYYRGYGGNYNRFPTEDMCQNTCRPKITIPPAPPAYPSAPPIAPSGPGYPAQPAINPYNPSPQPAYPTGPPVNPYNPSSQPYNPAPAPYNPSPAPYNPSPAPYNPSPAPYNPSPAPYNPGPAPYNPSPAPYNPGPAPYNPSPAPYNPSPAPYNPSPPVAKYSPAPPVYPSNPSAYTPAPPSYTAPPAERPSPCRGGQPSTVQYCSSTNGYQCPAGQYCHVGDGTQDTICCPAVSDNPCAQLKEPGSGDARLTRYYYDSTTGRCQSFAYYGLQGNQNNFETYDQCTEKCALNPCGTYGQPYAVNGQNIQCSSQQPGVCPPNYYCHMGADTYTTVCCPKAGEDPCNLPILQGSGPGRLQRWAYNARSQECQSFVYTGIGGNENNFITEETCRGTCRVSMNPCANGKALTTPGGGNSPLYCTTGSGGSCPAGSYCHMGAGAESTVCCPMAGADQCQLPLATGTGNAVLTRYYFDFGSSMCKAFTYTGMQGNENNFMSLAACRQACPEFENPCPSGVPPVNVATQQVRFCSQTNPSCPGNYWCHIGASRQTSVCCPNPSNPCTLQRSLGLSTGQLPRWFYDYNTRTCKEFIYTGTKGNQNNFMTRSDCEAACPVLDNPCSSGMPALNAQSNPVLCSTVNPDVCPPTYWCHVGGNGATTLCCPGATDPCRLPMSKGVGNSVLNRWYYNTDTQTCLSFTYSGKGGNQNNFLALADCRARCPEFQNPCSTGQPHIGLNGQITHCGATSPSICPTTYWCHVGSTLDTSVCCPGAGNPCELPLGLGNGNGALHRFYYDASRQACTAIQYTGMGGNENNFMTQTECEQRCPVFRNPCGNGEPARNNVGQVIPCGVTNLGGCPNQFWCHVGADEKTTLCCPSSGTDVCRQPLGIGSGSSALPRHYYNALTQQCLPFTYTGIGGNQNNFLSRADCERSCPVFLNPCAAGDPATGPNGQYVLCTAASSSVCPANYWCHMGDLNSNSVCCPGAENPCILPPATGNGNEAIARYYFDTNTRRCSQFTYTGTGGNQNNFLSLQDCQLRCPEFRNPCPYGDPAQSPGGGILFCSRSSLNCPASYWCHVGHNDDSTVCCPGASAPCMQSLQPGMGSAKLSRWYFNQNTRQCLEFTYTGLSGNQNNFLSEQMCTQQCPVFQNPCGSTLNPPQVVFCSAQTQNSCPAGYWCHVGVTPQTSVCCPGEADPCDLGVSEGATFGTSALSRWYFDKYSRTCRQFQYAGVGGNQNNFLTQAECQHKCPEFVNPCIGGQPFQEQATGMVKYCNQNVPTDCPAQFWCHVGASQQTTVCCPGSGDPCTLSVSAGNGPASLPRWYFNTATRQCQQFTYNGAQGNQNNFLTQRDCQLKCPEFNNPCGTGSPLTTVSGQIQYCSRQNPNICPPNYFCHIGVAQDTTVCCPGAGNQCNLPREVGRGSASIQRYFFNQVTRQCQSFSYTGTGGNANNFLTLSDCRRKCAEFSNPCGAGSPYTSPGGQLLYCNSGTVCPANFYCHYGKDSTTTMCCPTAGDPCSMPVVIGTGIAQMTRFYYNSALRSCVSFVYSGGGGNENNFRTQSECQARCQPAANPCGTNSQPLRDDSGNNVQCGSSTGYLNQACPSNYFCHVGNDVWNTVCCPTSGDPCYLPMAEGSGSGYLQRWYFNAATTRCQLFTYNGAAGNANNYLTEEDCQRACTTSVLRDGPCPQGEVLLDASGQKKTCEINYPQPEPRGCPTSYVCNLRSDGAGANCCPDPRYFCIQPRDPGGQRCPGSSVTRFGYSPQTDTCVPFRYSGCGGNLNNFYTLDSCTRVCCNKGFNKLFRAAASARFHDGSADVGNVTDDVDDMVKLYANMTMLWEQLNETDFSDAKKTHLGGGFTSWLPNWVRYLLH